MRRVLLSIGTLAGVLVIGAMLLDEGEFVLLSTKGATRDYVTELWIVEVDDRSFIRSNRPNSVWLGRLVAHPRVSLRRDRDPLSEVEVYEARLIDPESPLKLRVDTAMKEKYGFSDDVLSRIVDLDHSVVIELAPLPSWHARSKPIAESRVDEESPP